MSANRSESGGWLLDVQMEHPAGLAEASRKALLFPTIRVIFLGGGNFSFHIPPGFV